MHNEGLSARRQDMDFTPRWENLKMRKKRVMVPLSSGCLLGLKKKKAAQLLTLTVPFF